MKCTVNRLLKSEKSWIGTFEINGVMTYYTMEPANPIPVGTYRLSTYASPKRNGQLVPILLNVPGHSFIEIHIVSVPADTHDCLGLAKHIVGKDFVNGSKDAITEFYKVFFAAIDKGEKCTITYKEYGT